MPKQLFLLLAVSAIFVFSLAAAVVLFKFLKSSALIKKPGYQAGGALAGFLLVYAALYSSFDRLSKDVGAWEPVAWTITGEVRKADAGTHEGTLVRRVPPEPRTLTNASGEFRLETVRVVEAEGLPEIIIESEGYFPRTFQLSEENSMVEGKTIRLRDPIRLDRSPDEE